MAFRFTSKIAALLLGLMLSISTLHGQTNSPQCTNRLISGNYAFSVEGIKLGGPPGSPIGPMRGVAFTEFDGQNTVTQVDTIVVNGMQTSSFSEAEAVGTYTVNPNCTGTFNLTFPSGDPRPPITVDFVISENGNQIDSVVVAPPGALLIASHGKRRFRR